MDHPNTIGPFELDPDLKRRLQIAAIDRHKSMRGIIRELLDENLPEVPDAPAKRTPKTNRPRHTK